MNQLSLNIKIGLRYIRAKRRNGFISVISLISIIGIGLGVMALITIMSVMNGFEKDLQSRILGMASHATITSVKGKLNNWQKPIELAKSIERVLGAAPYIEENAMVTSSTGSTGVLLRGINVSLETTVSDIGTQIQEGSLESLESGKFRVIIGSALAEEHGFSVGSKVNLIVPKVDASIIGIIPRAKRFVVSGIFHVGMYEYDRNMIIVNINDAQILYKMKDAVSGVRLKVDDMLQAKSIISPLKDKLDRYSYIRDWTDLHTNFFKAIKTEKLIMFIILSLIVLVAAINIISTMVMMVTEKESEIAILRTLGSLPRDIAQIFLTQGIVIGMIGTLLGVISGVSLALNVETVVPAIEQLFGVKFLAPDVYYISDLPSELHWIDVIRVAGLSFAISTLATIYPAYRAAKVQPAQALRYE